MSGRSGRVDVIHERDATRRRRSGPEGRGDVPPPFGARQLALSGRATDANKRGLERAVPRSGKLARKLLGGVVPPPKPSIRIGGHEHDAIRTGTLDLLHDDGSRPTGKPPEAALLPRRHDPTDRSVVLDGRTRPCEGEPPAGTLRAARHGPRRRRPAALAPGRHDTAQCGGATAAHLCTGHAAHETVLREQQFEHDCCDGTCAGVTCLCRVGARTAPIRD